MPITVYAAPVGHPGADPGARQPAFRAWADALLIRLSSVSDPSSATSVGARSTGRIARSQREDPFVEPLLVEPSLCNLAIPSDRLPLFTPSGWSEGLLDYLVDNGIERDVVEEHLPACAAPLWPTLTEAFPKVLTETRSDLLLLVGRYFAHDIRGYLDSWRPLNDEDLSTGRQFEVVVRTPDVEPAVP